jgi:hypothetical protein
MSDPFLTHRTFAPRCVVCQGEGRLADVNAPLRPDELHAVEVNAVDKVWCHNRCLGRLRETMEAARARREAEKRKDTL